MVLLPRCVHLARGLARIPNMGLGIFQTDKFSQQSQEFDLFFSREGLHQLPVHGVHMRQHAIQYGLTFIGQSQAALPAG